MEVGDGVLVSSAEQPAIAAHAMTTTIKNGSCFTVRHYMRSLKPVNIFFCVSARARAGTGGHQGTRRWAGRLHRGTNDRRRRGSP